MTVDTGEHGKTRRPLPPVLAKETSEAVRSAESGVEVSRADDEHDRSLQFGSLYDSLTLSVHSLDLKREDRDAEWAFLFCFLYSEGKERKGK